MATKKEENDDCRTKIDHLLVEYSKQIEGVKREIEDHSHYEANHYDELWILRFILSHKANIKKATKAAIATMNFRHERKLNQLGDIRHTLALESMLQPLLRFTEEIMENPTDGMVSLPDENRGTIHYVLLNKFDMKKFGKKFSEEDTLNVYILLNEAIYQINDSTSRRTGRLTKHLKVTDLTDVPFQHLDLGVLKRDSRAAKAIEDFYPQLLGSSFFINPPTWVNTLWYILSPLIPKKVHEKMKFLSPRSNTKDKDLFYKYISDENLPAMFGGKNTNWPPPSASVPFRKLIRTASS